MTEDRIPLTLGQVAELRDAVRHREASIFDGVLQQSDYPPLPACPECDGTPEKITQRWDLNDAMLVHFSPCGHRFIADITP